MPLARRALLLALLPPLALSSVLTPQNFEPTVARGTWFVEHFSPYCSHCRRFEATWNELVDHFEAMPDPGVHLAQVNCALNGDLCNENGVTGYPQMNLYRDGELVETYTADRQFHLLVEYLNAHAEPTSPQRARTSQEPEPEHEPSASAPSSTQHDVVPTPAPAPTPTPSERLLVQAPRSDANPSGTVTPLDVQSFDSFLQQGPAFVKFFAPWCGHCKKLAPAWSQLGRRMQHKLNVAEVDCEQHKALCASQGVTGFPVMFYYAHGVKTEYTGGRSYDQLVSFADKASDPNMLPIDASELEQAVRANDVLYLLLHDASDPRIVNDVAKASQSLLGSPPVYVSTSPDLARKYGLAGASPSALLLAFKDGDAREPIATLSLPSSSSSSSSSDARSADARALAAWLHANRFPSSFELSKDVFQRVMYAPHRPLVLVVATPRGRRDEVSGKLRGIAQKWRLRSRAGAGAGSGAGVGAGSGTGTGARDVVFTWMDGGQWAKWMKEMYGIELGNEPEIVVADHERLLYYDEDGSGRAIALNSVSVASALEAILDGTARPKHSQNLLERGVRAANDALTSSHRWIVAHPYATVLVMLGLVGAVVGTLYRLLADASPSTTDSDAAEKRHVKRGRLD